MKGYEMDEKRATKRGIFYFAHPYSVKDIWGNTIHAAEEVNFRLSCIRAAELLRHGYNIYSPISHTHPIHFASIPMIKNNEHELWYHLDNEFIDCMDWVGIILSPGWEGSKGCVAERERITARGLVALTYEEALASDPQTYYREWLANKTGNVLGE